MNAVFGITAFGSIVRLATTLLLVPQIGMAGVFHGQVISRTADAVVSVILYWLFYRTEEQLLHITERI